MIRLLETIYCDDSVRLNPKIRQIMIKGGPSCETNMNAFIKLFYSLYKVSIHNLAEVESLFMTLDVLHSTNIFGLGKYIIRCVAVHISLQMTILWGRSSFCQIAHLSHDEFQSVFVVAFDKNYRAFRYARYEVYLEKKHSVDGFIICSVLKTI